MKKRDSSFSYGLLMKSHSNEASSRQHQCSYQITLCSFPLPVPQMAEMVVLVLK
jgi:hypothetical protein